MFETIVMQSGFRILGVRICYKGIFGVTKRGSGGLVNDR
jgi:hypothetical protein